MILELTRFKKVADVGSITRACGSLFITQPALTQSIHRLEEELGTKLFKKSGKKISITNEGQTVYELTEKILRLWNQAKNLKKTRDYSKVSIGLFDNAALDLTTYIRDNFKDRKFEIIIERSLSLVKKVNLGIIDICICVKPKELSAFPYVVIVKEYKEKLIPVSSKIWKMPLNKMPFILYEKDSQTQLYISQTFLDTGIKPNIIAESVNPLFLKELALKGYGVSILPENMVRNEIKEKKLFIQKVPLFFERTCAIFQNSEYIPEESRIIVNELKLLNLFKNS